METQTEIDLTPFCEPEATRYRLQTPFVQDGRRWATNGVIAVCVEPCSEQDTPPEEGRVPKMQFLVDGRPDAATSPWPEPLCRFGIGACRQCNGTGAKNLRDCDECEGEGEVRCDHCGNDYNCKTCHGRGKVLRGKCETCQGEKETEQALYLELGGAWITFEYDQKIRSLPNVRFRGVTKNQVWFDFDGGWGVIAPIDRGGVIVKLSEPRRYEPAA